MKRSHETAAMCLALAAGILLSIVGGAALTLSSSVIKAAVSSKPAPSHSCDTASPSDLLAILRAVLSAAGSYH